MLRLITATVIFLLLGDIACPAQSPKSAFTAAEVTAGHASYHGYCAGCHGEDMRGFTDAPPLTGATFRVDWSKYTIRRLYEFVSKTMPQGLEGDLKPKTYSNIVAFLLAANGAKTGSAPLNPDSGMKIGDIANGNTVLAIINAPIDPKAEIGP